jgi:hypothetical protein
MVSSEENAFLAIYRVARPGVCDVAFDVQLRRAILLARKRSPLRTQLSNSQRRLEAPMSDTPEMIWAWLFHPTEQNDAMQGGWTGERDKRVTRYRRDDLPPTDAQLMADPRVEALVDAASAQLQYMDWCNEKGDLERNLRNALAAFQQEDKR